MNYRPICDTIICARPKVPYYGAYPSGFLGRARAILGVSIYDPLLHVCGGRVKDYPFAGLGPNDRTVDLDPALAPDFLMDVRELGPGQPPHYGVNNDELWPAVLADPPYTSADAARYAPGSDVLPRPNDLLRRCLSIVRPGGRVGFLHYKVPRPPKDALFVALISVWCGYDNNIRAFSVFERASDESRAASKRALAAVRGKKAS